MQIAHFSLCGVNKKRFVRCVRRANAPRSLRVAFLKLINEFLLNLGRFRGEWLDRCGNVEAEEQGGQFLGGE
jgi:hypothetical protein